MNKPSGTILITGASSGLGLTVATQIASGPHSQDYHGIYTARNTTNARDLNVLRHRHQAHTSDLLELDLGSFAKVRAAANTINKRVADGSLPPIRALILNAGFQESTELNMSEDGFEMTFQVNYLSHFLFVLLLLQSMDKEHGRILVLSSPSHNPSAPNSALGIMTGAYEGEWHTLFTNTELLAKGKWSTPQDVGDGPVYHSGYRRYGASKLCVVMLMYELQSRLMRDPQLSNISVLGIDPGAMPTNLMRHASWWNRTWIMNIAIPLMAPLATNLQPNGDLRTTSKSATDVLRACFDTQALGQHPRAVYLNGTEEGKPSPEATDKGKREMLWKDSVAYVKLKEGETALKNWT